MAPTVHSVLSAPDPHPEAGHFHPDGTTVASCTESTGKELCLEQAFGNIAYRLGPNRAIAEVARLTRTSDEVLGDCHPIMHMIGSATLLRDHYNVHRAFAQGSSQCGSGYYHGILEHELVHSGGSPLQVARTICNGLGSTEFLHFQCLHGLGHGLELLYGYDLPKALDICARLQTPFYQQSCAGGVFMENFNPMYGFKTRYLKDSDLAYPCDATRWEFKYSCYAQVTFRMLLHTNWNWRAVGRMCTKVEHAWVLSCFDSYARDAAGSARFSVSGIRYLCSLAGSAGGDECLVAAATNMTSNAANGTHAAKLCLTITPRLRGRCFGAIGVVMKVLTRSRPELAAACRRLSPVWAASCERAKSY